jgi:hypothetical protein
MIPTVQPISVRPINTRAAAQALPGSAQPAADGVAAPAALSPSRIERFDLIEAGGRRIRPEGDQRYPPGLGGIGNLIREMLGRLIQRLFGQLFGMRPPTPEPIFHTMENGNLEGQRRD